MALTRTDRPTTRSRAITTTIAGIVTYRTRRPLTAARATRFALMLQANSRFLDATVVRSRAADRFHVCFLPSSADRITAMLDAEDAKDRAADARDGEQFLFTELDPRRVWELTRFARVFQCVGKAGTYETTLCGTGACTCPHFKYRRDKQGGECKHIKRLRSRAEAGLLDCREVAEEATPAPVVAPVAPSLPTYGSPAWKQKVSADFD